MKTKSYFEIIKTTDTNDLVKIGGVGKSMAGKYKRGENTPTLRNAVKFEKELNIPIEAWIYMSDLYSESKGY